MTTTMVSIKSNPAGIFLTPVTLRGAPGPHAVSATCQKPDSLTGFSARISKAAEADLFAKPRRRRGVYRDREAWAEVSRTAQGCLENLTDRPKYRSPRV